MRKIRESVTVMVHAGEGKGGEGYEHLRIGVGYKYDIQDQTPTNKMSKGLRTKSRISLPALVFRLDPCHGVSSKDTVHRKSEKK